ncbi:replication restart DNA helicase PriA [Haloactinospora alba]|uniref:Probable replication restart protein PriA n=1 Tax=Haloactinospora alba TaxID=405555 RepID=A0A543NHI8_9ACTN|nr:primosomal protein N' [Haloactinospora alba]TQN31315.1 replication restart DNA helicase PriA [Haloactinospora alba]
MTAQPTPGEGTLFDTPRAATAAASGPKKRAPAPEEPIARVAVDTPLPHLDRPFDYRVPESMHTTAVPGCRVRVRFGGQVRSGFLLERASSSDFDGQLSYLHQVVSSEPVLTPEVRRLSRAVADRYAGTLSDVLRLAIPPRHARVEREQPEPPQPAPAELPPHGPWENYPHGPSFLAALRSQRCPRAVWNALPGSDWADTVAIAAATALWSGQGTVAVLPDGRDVEALDTAMRERLGSGRHVALTADLGPAERYRRWLSVLRGHVRVVVGTRAAMFAPVHELGLVVLWDDGDDVHCDPHAPYPHARTVLTMRAHHLGTAALVGGFARTADAAQLIESGWAHPLTADRTTLRSHAPRVHASGDDSELARDDAARSARLPLRALRMARESSQTGPVLIQVPRRGYLASLLCQGCRGSARCASCQGPLAVRSAHAMPYCRWCGHLAGAWSCPTCGGSRLRAGVVGTRRTAEELGRAFPSLPVHTSGRDEVLTAVSDRPALVVATPGAEPSAPSGYTAALLLDGWALLDRADLRAAEEALRRWYNAASLVRPADDGGRVAVVAEAGLSATQALVRWDPAGFAERELAERRELGFPPAVAMASVTGEPEHVRELLADVTLPESAEVLGPVPVSNEDSDSTERALLRVPRGDVLELARALKTATAARSARKDEHLARVRMDPLEVV